MVETLVVLWQYIFLLRMACADRTSSVKHVPSPQKRRLSTSLAKCFICQKSSEGLTTPGDVGYSTFIKAVRSRFNFTGDLSHSWMKVVPQFMNGTDLK